MPKKNKSGISKSPWKMLKFPAAKGEDWRIVESGDKPPKVVAEVQGVENARLIAYAPDLLRISKAILEDLDDHPSPGRVYALRAAILKAEGH